MGFEILTGTKGRPPKKESNPQEVGPLEMQHE